MLTPASQISLLGFGPQAARLARALAPRGCALKAFDPGLQDAARAAGVRARIESHGVDAFADAATALRGARLVACDEGAPDAATLAALLQPGQLLLDFTRMPDEAAPAEADAPRVGGRFTVDGARLQVAGPRAPALAEALSALGLPTDAVSSATLRALPRPAPLPGSPRAPSRGELP